MSYLALDQSSSTGWALLCDGDVTQRKGHWSLFAERGMPKFRTKWRYFPEQDQTVGYGYWQLGVPRFEFRHVVLLDCLIELNRFISIDYLFWEQKFRTEGQFADDQASMYIASILTFARKRRPAMYRQVHNGAWSGNFIGKAEKHQTRQKYKKIDDPAKRKAAIRKETKSLCQQRAALYGLPTERDDEADAIGILDYSLLDTLKITPPWRANETLQPILEAAG